MTSTNRRFRVSPPSLVLAWVILSQQACVSPAASLPPQPVAVRQLEGEVRGFLVLRSLDGAIVADGDSMQTTHGSEVSSRLVFHFKDGSLQDETVVFSQKGQFHLLTDHMVQKGPSFKHPVDVSINGATGVVTVVYRDDKGRDKTESSRLQLPSDLANGMVSILLKNLPPGAQSATLSMIVASPKPLLIKLAITTAGEESFSTGAASHKATEYGIKVKIPGIRGVLAPMVGRQPADTRVWMMGGICPSFLKAEGPSAEGGPIWRTELISPNWQKSGSTAGDKIKSRAYPR